MQDRSEGMRADLVDFSNVVSRPRYIDISQRWTCGPVTIGRYTHHENACAPVGTTQCTVSVHEGNLFEMSWVPIGSKQFQHSTLESGHIQIHPPDTLIYKSWKSPSKMLFMAIDRSFASKVVADVFNENLIELEPKIAIRDPVITGMAEAWKVELAQRGAGGRIHAEALATALIVHIFRTYGGANNVQLATGGMSTARLSRVVNYIEENLGQNIGLTILAELAGLSVHHFSEVFKSELGIAPYHFIIARRIHRAKEMLIASEASIAEISADLGFSGQSHFTEHFRRLTGVTPMRFRLAKKPIIDLASTRK